MELGPEFNISWKNVAVCQGHATVTNGCEILHTNSSVHHILQYISHAEETDLSYGGGFGTLFGNLGKEKMLHKQ